MPDEVSALQQAQQKLEELLNAARDGSLIPIRLPGQIEEIHNLLDEAQTEQQEAAATAGVDGDYLQEEAYFVGHAVHELRTPMTSIRGYSDMLGQMGELNDMQKQFLDVIKANSRRMEGLLADVSYINKINKRTLQIAEKMDMFKNIAMKVEKDMQPRAEELNRQLEFDIPQGLPILNTDGDMLALAITKLVENGLQYSPEGEGKVVVKGATEGKHLVVHVTDNGIGMTPEEIAQLGTIYYRSERDEVRAYKGSGLGIPIAFGMVELLRGTIEVDSKPDSGTTFTIRIEGLS